MVKSKGAVQYGEDTEEYVLTVVDCLPKTCNKITQLARANYSDDLSRRVVNRILNKLHKQNRIGCLTKISKWKLWTDNATAKQLNSKY